MTVQPPPTPEEIRAAERQHDLTNDLGKRLIDGAMRDAQETMKALLLINSGGAVAILVFIETVISKSATPLKDLAPVTLTISWFLAGAVLAVLTAALAYITNTLYSRAHFQMLKTWKHPYQQPTRKSERAEFWAILLNWIAVISAALSLVMFVCGIIFSSIAILRFGSTGHLSNASPFLRWLCPSN